MTFVLFLQQTSTRLQKTKKIGMEKDFASQGMIYHSGEVTSYNLREDFFAIIAIAIRKPPTCITKDDQI